MKVVLDANEYIFGLGPVKEPSSEEVLKCLHNHDVFIVRRIASEVVANLPSQLENAFFDLLENTIFAEMYYNYQVPYELGKR